MRRRFFAIMAVASSVGGGVVAACDLGSPPAASMSDDAGASPDVSLEAEVPRDAGPDANTEDPDAPCASCAPTLLASGLVIKQITEHGGRLFWTDGSSIWAMPSAGGAVTELLHEVGASRISVDATGVYWSSDTEIHAAGLNGSNAHVLATRNDYGLSGFHALVANGGEGFVWWGGSDPLAEHVIGVVGVNGELSPDAGTRFSTSDVIGVSISVSGPFGVANDVLWTQRYWATLGLSTSLMAWVKDARRAVQVESTDTRMGTDLRAEARDATTVYWVVVANTGKPTSILKKAEIAVPATAPTTVRVFPDEEQIGRLLVDPSSVFVERKRRMWKMARAGGSLSPVVDLPPPYKTTFMDASVPGPVLVIQDATKIYLATESAIFAHSK